MSGRGLRDAGTFIRAFGLAGAEAWSNYADDATYYAGIRCMVYGTSCP